MIKLFLKAVLLIAMLGAGYLFYLQMMQQREFIEQENAAIRLYNEGEYAKAAETLEELLPKVRGETRTRVTRQLADWYTSLSQDPALSLQKQAAYARKALQYDEDAQIGQVMRLYLEKNPEP